MSNKELNSIINVVRALINSRKQPCTMYDILKDYCEIENESLPFAKFNFKNPYEFFSQTGEFRVQSMGNNIFLANIPNAKTAHVAKLVREQRSSKKSSTRLTKPTPPPPRQTNRYRSKNNPVKTYNTQNQNNEQEELKKRQQLIDEIEKRLESQFQQQKQKLIANFDQNTEQLKRDLEKKGNEVEALKKEVSSILESLQKQPERLVVIKQGEEEALLTNDKFTNEEELIIEAELVESKRVNAELKQLKERITTLSLDANNNRTSYCSMKSQQQQHISKSKPEQEYNKNIAKSSVDLRHRINEIRSQKLEPQQQQQSQQTTTDFTDETKKSTSRYAQQLLRPILGQNTQNNNCVPKNSKSKPNLQITIPNTVVEQEPQQQVFIPEPNMQQTSQQIAPRIRIQRFPSVQHRLKQCLNGGVDSNEVENPISMSPPITPVDEQTPRTAPKSKKLTPTAPAFTPKPKFYKFDMKKEPCASISEYCLTMNYDQPQYKVYRTRNGFEGQITIENKTTYSTYPVQYPDENIARQNAALRAIKQIQIIQSRKALPTISDESEFLNMLYNELLVHPHGIFSNKIEDWFAERFGYLIPQVWFLLVQKSRRFTLEQGVNENTYIILANPNVSPDDRIVVDSIKATPIQMEPLKLPWSEKSWCLRVTHAISTVEIWAYLLGEDYYDRFELLNEQIQNYMARKKIRPDVIAAKHYYLVKTRDSWDRVRVQTIHRETERALIFYIDYGDTEQLPLNELYFCDPQFLRVPPQAVPFSLFGLDDFANYPNADQILQKNLLNHCFIGEIITKEAELEANSTIQLILFDTSTDEDINLNDLLQKEFCKCTEKPRLKPQGVTAVTVTHVHNNNGDVSLQINGPELEYLQKTLKQIIETKLSREQHKCTPKELLRRQILLVNDDNDEWYRAKIINEKQIEQLISTKERKIDVLYIDYNIERKVNVLQIFRLESLSRALSKFPPQAIRVKLHNIPEFSSNVISRIRALLPENCDDVFVRVVVPELIPHVTISRRVKGVGMPFCNINDDLRLEIERTKDATLYNRSGSDSSTLAATTADSITSPNQLFLRAPTLTSEPMLPLKIAELPKLQEYDALPSLSNLFNVYVTVVSNPMSFTVQPYNKDYQRLLAMQTELQEFCAKNDAYIPADKVEIGQAYAAENRGVYFRVIAKARYGEMINVSFCDYGDTGTVRIDHLKVLPMKFRQLPIMGINAKLYGIRGRSDDIWSSDDVKRFRELVLDKKLASYVKKIARDQKNSLELTLDLVNVSGPEDIYISKVFLGEGRL